MRMSADPARTLLALWAGLILLFLYLPIAVVVWASFNRTEVIRFPISSYSLDWYRKLFSNVHLHDALGNSLTAAVSTAVAAIVIGIPLAVGMHRYSERSTRFIAAAVSMPMMAPRLIIGIALLNLFVLVDFPLSLVSVVAGHTIVALPYVVLIVGARYARADLSIEEAAWDLGASRLRTFLQVTLPNLLPAIAGATLIAFTLSFDEAVVSFFLAGVETTLPVQLWSMLRFGISPEINALATLTLLVSVALAVLAEIVIRSAAK